MTTTLPTLGELGEYDFTEPLYQSLRSSGFACGISDRVIELMARLQAGYTPKEIARAGRHIPELRSTVAITHTLEFFGVRLGSDGQWVRDWDASKLSLLKSGADRKNPYYLQHEYQIWHGTIEYSSYHLHLRRHRQGRKVWMCSHNHGPALIEEDPDWHCRTGYAEAVSCADAQLEKWHKEAGSK